MEYNDPVNKCCIVRVHDGSAGVYNTTALQEGYSGTSDDSPVRPLVEKVRGELLRYYNADLFLDLTPKQRRGAAQAVAESRFAKSFATKEEVQGWIASEEGRAYLACYGVRYVVATGGDRKGADDARVLLDAPPDHKGATPNLQPTLHAPNIKDEVQEDSDNRALSPRELTTDDGDVESNPGPGEDTVRKHDTVSCYRESLPKGPDGDQSPTWKESWDKGTMDTMQILDWCTQNRLRQAILTSEEQAEEHVNTILTTESKSPEPYVFFINNTTNGDGLHWTAALIGDGQGMTVFEPAAHGMKERNKPIVEMLKRTYFQETKRWEQVVNIHTMRFADEGCLLDTFDTNMIRDFPCHQTTSMGCGDAILKGIAAYRAQVANETAPKQDAQALAQCENPLTNDQSPQGVTETDAKQHGETDYAGRIDQLCAEGVRGFTEANHANLGPAEWVKHQCPTRAEEVDAVLQHACMAEAAHATMNVHGAVGSGKTHMAEAAASAFPAEHRKGFTTRLKASGADKDCIFKPLMAKAMGYEIHNPRDAFTNRFLKALQHGGARCLVLVDEAQDAKGKLQSSLRELAALARDHKEHLRIVLISNEEYFISGIIRSTLRVAPFSDEECEQILAQLGLSSARIAVRKELMREVRRCQATSGG